MEIIDQFIKLAANNEVTRLKKLIECGINVNGFDSKGRTALMAATFFNHIDVVTLLISAEADPTIKSIDGRTALDIAKTKNYHSIIEILETQILEINNRPTNSTFNLNDNVEYFTSSKISDSETIEKQNDESSYNHLKVLTIILYATLIIVFLIFISNKITQPESIDILNKKLIDASKNGQSQTILELIRAGANINATDEIMATPLIHAVINRRTSLMQTLISNGAYLNHKDKNGKTAFCHAINSNNIKDAAELLANNSFEININSDAYKAFVQYVLANPSKEYASLLIAKNISERANLYSGYYSKLYAGYNDGYFEQAEKIIIIMIELSNDDKLKEFAKNLNDLINANQNLSDNKSLINQFEKKIEDLEYQQKFNIIVNLNAFIVAELDAQVYEAALPYYDPYHGNLPSKNHIILRTSKTAFYTKGWFNINAINTGYYKGFSTYREAEEDEIYQAELITRSLIESRNKLIEIKPLTTVYENEAFSIHRKAEASFRQIPSELLQ